MALTLSNFTISSRSASRSYQTLASMGNPLDSKSFSLGLQLSESDNCAPELGPLLVSFASDLKQLGTIHEQSPYTIFDLVQNKDLNRSGENHPTIEDRRKAFDQIRPLLLAIHATCQKPGYQPLYNYNHIDTISFEDIHGFRLAAKLLCVEARLCALEGNVPASLNSLSLALTLLSYLRQIPFAISTLIQSSICHDISSAAIQCTEFNPGSGPIFRTVLNRIPLPPIGRVLYGECYFSTCALRHSSAMDIYRDLRDSEIEWNRPSPRKPVSEDAALPTNWLARAIFGYALPYWISLFATVNLDGSIPDEDKFTAALQQALQETNSESGRLSQYFSTVFSTIEGSFQVKTRCSARISLSNACCLAVEFRHREGRWPDSNGELEIAPDAPLQYSQTDSGLTIRSGTPTDLGKFSPKPDDPLLSVTLLNP